MNPWPESEDPRKAIYVPEGERIGRNAESDSPLALVGGVLILASGLLFLGGVGILAYQFFLWLRYGFWFERYFYEAFAAIGLGALSTTWGGIEKIIEWIMECPLSGGLIWASFLPFGLAVCALMIDENRKAEERLRKQEYQNRRERIERERASREKHPE